MTKIASSAVLRGDMISHLRCLRIRCVADCTYLPEGLSSNPMTSGACCAENPKGAMISYTSVVSGSDRCNFSTGICTSLPLYSSNFFFCCSIDCR